MNNNQSRQSLNRGDFLKLLAAAGATAAGGYALYTYTPWLNYEEQARQNRRPLEKGTSISEAMLELIRFATLAPNGHNTQPWKFAIKENAIEIHPDLTRKLPAVDPQDRELWISLGCALENLIVSARAVGYEAEVTYPDTADFIQIGLTASVSQGGELFDAIPIRQNTRSEYDGQPVKAIDLDEIQALALEPGVTLHFVTTPANIENLLEYVNRGNLIQYADQAFVDELIHWLRFNKKESLASLDGLYTLCSGNPEVPGWLGRMVVAGTKPQDQADTDAKKLRSSAGAAIVATETEDRTAWVRTGQVYERMALKMTALNIKSAFLNQPVEVAEVRGQFQTAMSLGTALPQLLVRFGYAEPMPQSVRRAVEDVLM